MSQFLLTNERAIAFFKKHSHLDFNVLNGIFVDIMENLIQNMSDSVESSHNTELLVGLTKRLETMESSFIKHNESVTTMVSRLNEQFSTMIVSHLESMLGHMRDTIKSNNGDSERNILQRIQENNELFLSKIETLSKDDAVRDFFAGEMNKMNSHIKEETEKLMGTVQRSDSNELVKQVNDVILSQYRDLDNNFKARIDSFFASQSSTQGSAFTEIMNRLEKTTSAVDVVGDYFQRQIGSTNKGKHGETKLELILSQLFPSASIKNTAGMTAMGDFIVERVDKSKILIDTKDYDTVVPVKEVEKLIRDVEKNNCHGILISQKTGIAQKDDFEINVHNHKIIVFIHSANYDGHKIQLAFSIIDHLEPHVVAKNDEGESISSELLALINKEYQELVRQKLNLIETVRKSQSDIIQQIQRIDLPALTKYLDKKFANTGKTGLGCDICNVFIGKNPKSLAAHRRRCQATSTNVVISTDDNTNTQPVNVITTEVKQKKSTPQGGIENFIST